MHQQTGDRSCTLASLQPPAIGGAHWGPVNVYMSKVADARTADGSTPFFKVFANAWSPANNGAGDNDWWGVKDMENCCGRGMQSFPSQTVPSQPISIPILLTATSNSLHPPPTSRHKNPHRHRPRRLPPARRSHRPAHRFLPQPSPILHLLLPNNRSRVGNRHTVRCPLPRSVQEHRPRNPRGHPPKNELLCEPRPQRLRRRRLQNSWQLEVYGVCGDVRAWRQTRHRSKSTLITSHRIASLS